MTIVERFLRLDLPVDQCVVIGSGVLDALRLRQSRDIDLVTSDWLFNAIAQQGDWRSEERHGETVLLRGDVEIWRSWGSEGAPNFEWLFKNSLEVQGVHFANPKFVLEQKRQSAREKDMHDIRLLEEYLNNAAR